MASSLRFSAFRALPLVAAASSAQSDGLEHYRIGEALGSGTFATVYRAKDRGTGEKVAVKKIRIDDGCVQREVAALTRIKERGDHPNVAGMRACDDESWLATELVDGVELFDYLVRRGSFTEKTAADAFKGVFSAMATLHSWGVVHSDIKPENLVLTGDLKTVKVVDFGSALLDGQAPKNAFRYGTPFYSPPELLDAKLKNDPQGAAEAFTSKADSWALGVVLYLALLGCHPFDPENDLDSELDFAHAVQAAFLRSSSRSSTPEQHPEQQDEEVCVPLEKARPHLSPAAFDLLSLLLKRDPKDRATVETCLAHPWFNGAAGSSKQLDHLSKNIAKWRRFKQRLEATALDALVARASSSKRGGTSSVSRTTANFDDALTGLLDAVLVEPDDDKEDHHHHRGNDDKNNTNNRNKSNHHAKEEEKETQKKKNNREPDSSRMSRAMVEDVLGSLRLVDLLKGETVFNYGDDASTDAAEMFFITSGEVAVVRHGSRVATLKEGEFFGEGSIVAPKRGHTRRSATVTVTRDAKLVAVSRADVQRLSLDARDADNRLRAVAFERALDNTKIALSAARAAKRIFLKQGQPACEEGDLGQSIFSIEDGNFDVVRRVDGKIATLDRGDFFGEVAILDGGPRNAAVVCANPDGCVVHELASKAFLALLKRDPRADHAVRSLLKKRRLPLHQ